MAWHGSLHVHVQGMAWHGSLHVHVQGMAWHGSLHVHVQGMSTWTRDRNMYAHYIHIVMCHAG